MLRTVQFFTFLTFWLILSGKVTIERVVLGCLISLILTYVQTSIYQSCKGPLGIPDFWRLTWFTGIVMIEIFIAAFNHMKRIIRLEERTAIFEVELESDNQIVATLIANAITLTPGTITLEIDGKVLTVLTVAQSKEDIMDSIDVILNKFQKPFVWRRS